MEVPGIRFDDTMYLLEKLAARGVDYLHFSVGATLRPSIVDTSDPTPLIEKYCAMRSDTLAQVPVMGVGGVVNVADAELGLDHGYDLIAVGRACIAYPDWTARIAAGEELELFIDSTQREALHIPEPLWRFSLVEAMIRDMSMGDAKFKPGMFVETVQDDANELVINVSLEMTISPISNWRRARCRPWSSPPASKRSANVFSPPIPRTSTPFPGPPARARR